MKVEVKKIDSNKREMKFEIPKDRVSKELDEVYKELGKTAKVKGFRQGKAPRQVLESQHRKTAQSEMLKKLVPEVYREGIQQEKIDPLDLPEIHDVSFKDGVVTFTAKLDIKPEVMIKDYKRITVRRKSSQVTEEELNKTLEMMKKGQGKDEERTFDDAFARGLGYPNLNEFKKFLTRQLEMDKDRHSRMDIEHQIVEHVITRAKLVVPESFVKKQIEHQLKQKQNNMKAQGMSEEETSQNESKWREELRPLAERDVKVYLIFDKIAELENIEIKQEESLPAKVMEFLLKEAKWEGAK